jgi:hypothetical protein
MSAKRDSDIPAASLIEADRRHRGPALELLRRTIAAQDLHPESICPSLASPFEARTRIAIVAAVGELSGADPASIRALAASIEAVRCAAVAMREQATSKKVPLRTPIRRTPSEALMHAGASLMQLLPAARRQAVLRAAVDLSVPSRLSEPGVLGQTREEYAVDAELRGRPIYTLPLRAAALLFCPELDVSFDLAAGPLCALATIREDIYSISQPESKDWLRRNIIAVEFELRGEPADRTRVLDMLESGFGVDLSAAAIVLERRGGLDMAEAEMNEQRAALGRIVSGHVAGWLLREIADAIVNDTKTAIAARRGLPKRPTPPVPPPEARMRPVSRDFSEEPTKVADPADRDPELERREPRN